MTPEERKAALMQMLAERAKGPDMQQARDNANQGNFAANMGQAGEGFVRARGQAVGGQGVSEKFYDTMRNSANAGLGDAQTQRAEALKAMLLSRRMDEADKSAALNADESQFQRGRQMQADDRAERNLAITEKSQGHQSKRRFETRVDPNYGAYSYDTWTGKAMPLDIRGDRSESTAIGNVTTENSGFQGDSPPRKSPDETGVQYKSRLRVWEAQQKKQGKNMTSGTVSEVAELDAAEALIDDLWNDYTENASGVGSSILAKLPFTDASNYDQTRRQKAQVLGGILEGGKLTDMDFERYYNMMPSPGDTNEKAKLKLDELRQTLGAKRNAKINTLDDAGFDVGILRRDDTEEKPSTPVNQPQPTPSRQQEAPYGNRVAQGGKVYVWDGEQYVEE